MMKIAGSLHGTEGDRAKGDRCATIVEGYCFSPIHTPPAEGPPSCEPDQANHRGVDSQVQTDGGCRRAGTQ